MKKILYIEDEPEEITTLQEFLGVRGYEVISAKDGEEGLKKVREEKPDLILLDHFLPKIQGFEICKCVKQNPETKDIPLIIITASGVEYLESQCKSIGADTYLRKPYEMSDLLAKIKVLLGEIK